MIINLLTAPTPGPPPQEAQSYPLPISPIFSSAQNLLNIPASVKTSPESFPFAFEIVTPFPLEFGIPPFVSVVLDDVDAVDDALDGTGGGWELGWVVLLWVCEGETLNPTG